MLAPREESPDAQPWGTLFPWASLPAHILRIVFGSLHLPFLAKCACVSKHWHASFSTSELFWQKRLERCGCETHTQLSTGSHADARGRLRRAITCHRSWTSGRAISRLELAAPGIGQISSVDFDDDGVRPLRSPCPPSSSAVLPFLLPSSWCVAHWRVLVCTSNKGTP